MLTASFGITESTKIEVRRIEDFGGYYVVRLDDFSVIDIPEPIAKAFLEHYKLEIQG